MSEFIAPWQAQSQGEMQEDQEGEQEGEQDQGEDPRAMTYETWSNEVKKRKRIFFHDQDTEKKMPMTYEFILEIALEFNRRVEPDDIVTERPQILSLISYPQTFYSTNGGRKPNKWLAVNAHEVFSAMKQVMRAMACKVPVEYLILKYGRFKKKDTGPGYYKFHYRSKKKITLSRGRRTVKVNRGDGTSTATTPEQRHNNIRDMFRLAVTRKMRYNRMQNEAQLGDRWRSKVAEGYLAAVEKEYNYLISRLKPVSFIKVFGRKEESKPRGFVTDVPGEYNQARRSAIGQLGGETRNKEQWRKLTYTQWKAINRRNLKRENPIVRPDLDITDPDTDPIQPWSNRPARTLKKPRVSP